MGQSLNSGNIYDYHKETFVKWRNWYLSFAILTLAIWIWRFRNDNRYARMAAPNNGLAFATLLMVIKKFFSTYFQFPPTFSMMVVVFDMVFSSNIVSSFVTFVYVNSVIFVMTKLYSIVYDMSDLNSTDHSLQFLKWKWCHLFITYDLKKHVLKKG